MWLALNAWPSRLGRAIKGGLAARKTCITRCLSLPVGLLPSPSCRRLSSTPGSPVRLPAFVARHRPLLLVAARAIHSRSDTVDPEVQEYWRGVLQGVDKPTAVKLLQHIDPEFPLGLPPAEAGSVGGGAAGGGRRKTPPVFFYFLKTKQAHPTKVVLVRVGEFFETVGIDAVLLVQYAGLNPMGAGNPPRAGCPRQNLRRTVADLVHAGLSVVVCEEVSEAYSYGYRRTNTKERYIAQVLTPATPHLLYGLIDEDADVAFESTPPLIGISMQVGGFTVIEVNVELFKVTVTQGLTEDAVYARLYEGGLSPPLFIHIPGGTGGREVSTALAPWERRVAHTFRSQAGSVERYTGADPVAGLVARVRQLLNIPPNVQFTTVSSTATDQPRPLYHSTATNLGLHSSRGVPPLLDYLVPPSTPAASRAWLHQLLMFPPPPRVGAAMLEACTCLLELETAVPTFPTIGVTNVVLKLRQQEANDIFFRELAALCESVEEACSASELVGLSDALLMVAAHATGLSFPREELAKVCSVVLSEIGNVVEQQERVAGNGSRDEVDEAGSPSGDTMFEALRRFQRANENRFRGRVQNWCIPREHEAVENGWRRVADAVQAMMAEVSAALAQRGTNGTPGSTPTKSAQPTLTYNSVNNAVWLKVPKVAAAAQVLKELGLKHPTDRLGNAETGYYSTREVDSAQDAYRRACAEAADAVKARLRALADRLQDQLPPLVTATMFATVATALTAHMHEAVRRGWVLPRQLYPHDYVPGAAMLHQAAGTGVGTNGSGSIDIQGMWPYWLEGHKPEVVRNDCSMQGMLLLTGPNMAGKSTVLRTLCAVSLLAACGLAAPARAAAVPYLDAFMLRNFSADSPVDGRSSFAVEMTEMRHVLGDVSASSLVLVDELGKGTEVRAGAALAGAMLEELARISCKGIFATHLHVLLDMDLRLPGVELMQMEVRPVQRRDADTSELVEGLEATLRMAPGSNRESLALEVARTCQVPRTVLRRAAELYGGMHTATYGKAGAEAVQQQDLELEGQQVLGRDGGAAGAAGMSTLAPVAGDSGAGVPLHEREQRAPLGQRTLQEAGQVLQDTTAHILASLRDTQQQQQQEQQQQQQEQHNAAAHNGSTAELGRPAQGGHGGIQAHCGVQVQYVRRGQDPPPRTVGCACVYVVRREDGAFYVGSTDSLRQRITAHRRRKPSSSSSVGGGPGIEVAYVALAGDAGGASMARAAEAAVIQTMQHAGFPLLSATDAWRKHAPKFT